MFMGLKYPSKHFQCFALLLSYINWNKLFGIEGVVGYQLCKFLLRQNLTNTEILVNFCEPLEWNGYL